MSGVGKIVLIIILLVGLSAAGYGAYAVYDERRKKSSGEDGETPEETPEPKNPKSTLTASVGDVFEAIKSTLPSGSGSVAQSKAAVFPLQKGSKGPEVAIYQIYLNTRYGSKLVEDGIWGSATQAASLAGTGLSSVSLAQYRQFVQILETYHKGTAPTALKESKYGGYSNQNFA